MGENIEIVSRLLSGHTSAQDTVSLPRWEQKPKSRKGYVSFTTSFFFFFFLKKKNKKQKKNSERTDKSDRLTHSLRIVLMRHIASLHH